MRKYLPVLVGAGLCLATLLTWWPVLGNGFLNYDDGGYVTHNDMVRQGLSWATVPWAFRSTLGGNWHPLTWLSHALDCQWYGLNPAGHHLTSLLLHTLNAALLFGVLRRLTGALWRSAFTAALFALHPLRVESVAWVAERKDVLSASFFLLTVWAYAAYVGKSEGRNPKAEGLQATRETKSAPGTTQLLSLATRPSSLYYVLALVCFALGLLSKPMLVTLPVVLLLLDYWPLGRLKLSTFNPQPSTLLPLLREKLPFLVLAAVVSWVTWLVQRTGGNVAAVPLSFRLANVPVAYAGYLFKFLWPQHLAVIYPRPASWPAAQVACALALLVSMTVLVRWRGRAQPYYVTGWFWFLGMLAPVIGLVAIGEHWRADRYTYLPAIGLTLALVWGAADLAGRRALARKLVVGAGVLALAACALATRAYLNAWRDSLTLFEQAIRVTPNNYVAYVHAATFLRGRAEHNRAGEYCAKALLLAPGYSPAWDLMASLLAEEGKLTEALTCASHSVSVAPKGNGGAYYNRGSILLELGRPAEADFERALQLNPEQVAARLDLATLLSREGQLDRAIEQYTVALRLAPGQPVGHYDFANTLSRAGRLSEAVQHYERALQLNPTNAPAHCNLAQALLRQGLTNQALAHFEAALRVDPALPQAHYGLGVLLRQRGESAQALTHLRLSLRPNADFPAALEELAWMLATDSQPELRDGAEAVRAAQRACQLAGQPNPHLLLTLAAAYAEAGRLNEAQAAATQAGDLARAAGQAEQAGLASRLLELFQAGRAFHEEGRGQ